MISTPPTPPVRPWMMFVDGENLTIRCQEVAKQFDVVLNEDARYKKDIFFWKFPNPGKSALAFRPLLSHQARRAYYYTSVAGDQIALDDVKRDLWNLKFAPQVFKKDKQRDRSKGVDISLTKDMLSHAFFGHYEIAVLLAGDGDYVPLVEEVKRMGKMVMCLFVSNGLNEKLKMACDEYHSLEDHFEGRRNQPW